MQLLQVVLWCLSVSLLPQVLGEVMMPSASNGGVVFLSPADEDTISGFVFPAAALAAQYRDCFDNALSAIMSVCVSLTHRVLLQDL